jgi:hypothetical protein
MATSVGFHDADPDDSLRRRFSAADVGAAASSAATGTGSGVIAAVDVRRARLTNANSFIDLLWLC